MILTTAEYKKNLLREIRFLEKDIISLSESFARLKRDGHESWAVGYKINNLIDEMQRKTVDLLNQ